MDRGRQTHIVVMRPFFDRWLSDCASWDEERTRDMRIQSRGNGVAGEAAEKNAGV